MADCEMTLQASQSVIGEYARDQTHTTLCVHPLTITDRDARAFLPTMLDSE
jgi:hypothetical protein